LGSYVRHLRTGDVALEGPSIFHDNHQLPCPLVLIHTSSFFFLNAQRRSMDRGHEDELLCQRTGGCCSLRSAGALRGRAHRRPGTKLPVSGPRRGACGGQSPSSWQLRGARLWLGAELPAPALSSRQPGWSSSAAMRRAPRAGGYRGRGEELATAMGRAQADLASGQASSSSRLG
jgi:hypothetical protein